MKWHKSLVLLLVIAFSAWALAVQADNPQDDDDTEMMEADVFAHIIDVNGEEIGDVHFYQEDGYVWVETFIKVDSGITPGFHGFHIHGIGLCEYDIDAPFTTAGGHWNPDETPHGEHPGDLPSLLVLENGRAKLTFATDRFTVDQLFDEDGSAMMIHAGSDNYGNIPERYGGPDEATLGAGDAGSRVGCGVIKMGDDMDM